MQIAKFRRQDIRRLDGTFRDYRRRSSVVCKPARARRRFDRPEIYLRMLDAELIAVKRIEKTPRRLSPPPRNFFSRRRREWPSRRLGRRRLSIFTLAMLPRRRDDVLRRYFGGARWAFKQAEVDMRI